MVRISGCVMVQESAVDRMSACIERRRLSPTMVTRKSDAPESSGANALRQRVGNQGIQRLMAERAESGRSSGAALPRSLPIQTKLTVSEAGDAHEREADHVADVVMRMPANQVQWMCADCEGEQKDNAVPQVQRGAWWCYSICGTTRCREHSIPARRRQRIHCLDARVLRAAVWRGFQQRASPH